MKRVTFAIMLLLAIGILLPVMAQDRSPPVGVELIIELDQEFDAVMVATPVTVITSNGVILYWNFEYLTQQVTKSAQQSPINYRHRAPLRFLGPGDNHSSTELKVT